MTLAIVLIQITLAHDVRHLLLIHWPNLLAIFARECTLLELITTSVGIRTVNIEIAIVGKWVQVVACGARVWILFKIWLCFHRTLYPLRD